MRCVQKIIQKYGPGASLEVSLVLPKLPRLPSCHSVCFSILPRAVVNARLCRAQRVSDLYLYWQVNIRPDVKAAMKAAVDKGGPLCSALHWLCVRAYTGVAAQATSRQ